MDLKLYKKVKKEKKMTIADIAKAANLPKGTVQNIFCGYIPNPRIDTIKSLYQPFKKFQQQNYIIMQMKRG